MNSILTIQTKVKQALTGIKIFIDQIFIFLSMSIIDNIVITVLDDEP